MEQSGSSLRFIRIRSITTIKVQRRMKQMTVASGTVQALEEKHPNLVS